MDCHHIGELNVRGGCGRCGSAGVISQELVEMHGASNQRARAAAQAVKARRTQKRVKETLERLRLRKRA